MSKEKSLLERDFPIEYLNLLTKKVTHPAARAPVYNMHKWWARRPGPTFKAITLLTFLKEFEDSRLGRFVEVDATTKFNEWFWGVVENGKMTQRGVFYKPIDLSKYLGYRPIILDPFMGGGTTVVEALRLGCKVIGVDLSPVAWFVTKKEIEQVDLGKLDETFKELENKVASEIKQFYTTLCPKCLEEGKSQEDAKAEIVYIFWVKKLPCLTCGKEVKLFRNYILANPKGKSPLVFCPNCGYIFEARAKDLEERCAKCGFAFTPSKGPASPIDKETGKRKKGMYECSSGHIHRTIDTTRRLLSKRVKKSGIWYPEEAEIYAVEYYCSTHGRHYKIADDYDRQMYDLACQSLRTRAENLKRKGINLFDTQIPHQEIPKDKADPRPNNYGYKYFWQMFNERQLLSLSILLQEILKVQDRNVREFLLMVFSDILNFNNTFCAYSSTVKAITDLFSRHGYPHKVAPIENNVWGAESPDGNIIGRGSFKGYFLKSKKGLNFQKVADERFLIKDKTEKITVGDSVNGLLARNFYELTNTECNALLLAKDSQNLSFINGKVDAVITDPPYYDNVMYGELADFYYVWLRLGLKDHYDEFKPLYTPKTAEIVVNRKAKKFHKDYIRMLTNVFRECFGVLKENGLMVLTYHHKNPETWAAILEATLKPGFNIVATYPIYSEMKVSTHIRARGARQFDTIIVARKRLPSASEPELVQWEKVKDEIYIRARDAITRVRKSHPNLSNGDIATIILGKCLEVYSRHYLNVYSGNKQLKVPDAFRDIRDIISELYSTETVPPSDRVTEFYLRHLAKRSSIEYNELLKIVQSSEFGTSIDELKNMNILISRGNYLIIVDPKIRGRWLSENFDPMKKGLPSYIDAVHYLYHRYKEGKRLPTLEEIGNFNEGVTASLLTYMARELKDEDYKKILDLIKAAEKTPRGLERYM